LAPGRLELVRAFVNTADIDTGADSLTTPEELVGWLQASCLLSRETSSATAELERARALRRALRAALAANHERGTVPKEALVVLNAAAVRGRMGLQLTADARWVAQPHAPGVDGALASLIAVTTEAMSDGTWSRLKVCLNDTCQWAFYDQSRARSGKWCSMQGCGNRAKQQAWRARRSNSAQ